MRNRLNNALKMRQRAMEAAQRLGYDDDALIHRRVIRQLRARLEDAARYASPH